MLSAIKNLRLPLPPTLKSDNLKISDMESTIVEIYKNCFAELVPAVEPLQPVTPLCHDDFLERRSNQAISLAPTADDVWIFGYGSLVWKADFPYIDRRRGYIRGYKRRFYQHSIDHRGIPEKPGRVVTLMPGDMHEDRVYGVAYRIAADQKANVLDHLDYREKNGYERCQLSFYEFPTEKSEIICPTSFDVIMYIATQENDSYAGNDWQVDAIAKQIFSSAGPSGPNREYLFNLDKAMRVLFPGVVDDHLTELINAVQNLITHEEPKILAKEICQEIGAVLMACYKEAQQNDEVDEASFESTISEGMETLHKNLVQSTGWRERFIARHLRQEEHAARS